jgi:hypothetical protein
MIVIENDKSLQLVEQVEHARLSLAFLQRSNLTLNASVRTAIEHHDDGWKEYDEQPRFDNQQIIDYRSVPLETHLEILSSSVQRCVDLDAYAGWLVSRHGCSFHDDKDVRTVKTFLTEQEGLRERLTTTVKSYEEKHTTRDFNLLQFFDALSLYLLDPWSDYFDWNRDHPGTVRIRPESSQRFNYRSDNLDFRDQEFKFSYRSLPTGDNPGKDTLKRYYGESPTYTGNIFLKES